MAVSVLMLKAADAKYMTALERCPRPQSARKLMKAYFIEALNFEYINVHRLVDVLIHLERYSGILFTSPRSAIAINKLLDEMDASVRGKVLEKLQVKPVYSVGAATSRELLPLGVICKGDDAGSADALCNYLHQRGALPPDAKEKPMIFLCGDKRREVLPNSFRSRGLPLEELVVYQTSAVQNINFPDDCKVPNWIVFFSPSGLNVIKDMALPWKSIRKAAIGKTTASALRQHAVATNEAFWEPDVTASMPDPESLACAIFDFEERNLS